MSKPRFELTVSLTGGGPTEDSSTFAVSINKVEISNYATTARVNQIVAAAMRAVSGHNPATRDPVEAARKV